MIEIKTSGEKLLVTAPHSNIFRNRVKQIGGKWISPFWEVPALNRSLLESKLDATFNHHGQMQPKVVVDLRIDEWEMGSELMFGSCVVLKKWNRDSMPELSADATVIRGELLESGGSAKNPVITHEKETTIRLRNVPLSVYQAWANDSDVTLVEDADPDSDELTKPEAAALKLLFEMDHLSVQKVINAYSTGSLLDR